MTIEERNFLESLLPAHPEGALGMLKATRDYAIEHNDKGLLEACNRELANLN